MLQDTKSICKTVAFLYTNGELMMNRNRNLKNNSLYNCIKRIKYIGINLVKVVKGLYIQNYKIL